VLDQGSGGPAEVQLLGDRAEVAENTQLKTFQLSINGK
jgi:hypothetical protein